MEQKRKNRTHVSPWVPNQHGAWSMLLGPAIAATVVLIVELLRGAAEPVLSLITAVAVPLAWLSGYCLFFAFGLWVRAKNPQRKKGYAKPFSLYGPVCAGACLLAVILRPHLVVWAFPFALLTGIAAYETWRGRPRSLLSGTATTIASAFIIPAMWHIVAPVTAAVWLVTAFIAAYHTSSEIFVKSLIRQRDNTAFWYFSIGYHVVALIVSFFLIPVGGSWPYLVIVVFAGALVLAVLIPKQQRGGKSFAPKQVGLIQIPLLLMAYVAVVLALV